MKISFKKIFNKTNLPTIKIKINNNSYLFLLDTGSDVSYIDTSILENENFKFIGVTKFIDYTSNIRYIRLYSIEFLIGKKKFESVFGENICCESFKELEKLYNIKLCGIIGSKTMKELKLDIDFNTMYINV